MEDSWEARGSFGSRNSFADADIRRNPQKWNMLDGVAWPGTNLDALERMAFGGRRKAIKRSMGMKVAAEWSPYRLMALNVVESSIYNVAMVIVILLNVVHLVRETDMRRRFTAKDVPLYMTVISDLFLAIYTADLALRILVFRSIFPKSGMNIFDSLVVVVDIILTALPSTVAELPSLSVLRGLRMLRIVRVIRNLVAFRELYLMMQGLVSAVRAIIFGTGLIVAVLILWSILAVELVQDVNLQLWEEGVYDNCDRCREAFATVGHAMLTFTSTIIAGDSWGFTALPLMEREPWTALIILPALLSLELGLLNVVAAVIVDRQAQARQDDEKFLHQMRDEELKKSYGRLKALFGSMDGDGSGALTLAELTHSYRTHEEFKELMELMDIQEEDLALVFSILDKDASGDVDYEEFVEQLNTMRSTNSHTLLVFIKHIVSELFSQANHHDKTLKQIGEHLGIRIADWKRSAALDIDKEVPERLSSRASESSLVVQDIGESLLKKRSVKKEQQQQQADLFEKDAWYQDVANELVDVSDTHAPRVNSAHPPKAVKGRPQSTREVLDSPEPTFNSPERAFESPESAKGKRGEGRSVSFDRKMEVSPVNGVGSSAVAEETMQCPLSPRSPVGRSCQLSEAWPSTSSLQASADMNLRFIALSRRIQSSLAALTEDAVRQAGDKALCESTLALATLQASLPLLHETQQSEGGRQPVLLAKGNDWARVRPLQLQAPLSRPSPRGDSATTRSEEPVQAYESL